MNCMVLLVIVLSLAVGEVRAVNIRGAVQAGLTPAPTPQNLEPFKKFWNANIQPLLPVLLQVSRSTTSTLPDCDSTTLGANTAACWTARYQWITSTGGNADLLTAASQVYQASTTINQTAPMLTGIKLGSVDSDMQATVSLAVTDLTTATDPAVYAVNSAVQSAQSTASTLSNSLGTSFNSSMVGIWSKIANLLSASGAVDAKNINSLVSQGNALNGNSAIQTPLVDLLNLETKTAPTQITADSTDIVNQQQHIAEANGKVDANITFWAQNLTASINAFQGLVNADAAKLQNSTTNSSTTVYKSAIANFNTKFKTSSAAIASTINVWQSTTNGSLNQMYNADQNTLRNISLQISGANSTMNSMYSQVASAGNTSTTNSSSNGNSSAAINAQLQSLANYATNDIKNTSSVVVEGFKSNATQTLANLNSALATAQSAINAAVHNGTSSTDSSLGSQLTKSFSAISSVQNQMNADIESRNRANLDQYTALMQKSRALRTIYNKLTATLQSTQDSLQAGTSNNASSSFLSTVQNLVNVVSNVQNSMNAIGANATLTATAASAALANASTAVPAGIASYASAQSANLSSIIDGMVGQIDAAGSAQVGIGQKNIDDFVSGIQSLLAAMNTQSQYATSETAAVSSDIPNKLSVIRDTISSAADNTAGKTDQLIASIVSYNDSLASTIGGMKDKALTDVKASVLVDSISPVVAGYADAAGSTRDTTLTYIANRDSDARKKLTDLSNLISQFMADTLAYRQLNTTAETAGLLGEFGEVETTIVSNQSSKIADSETFGLAGKESSITGNRAFDSSALGQTLLGLDSRRANLNGDLARDESAMQGIRDTWKSVLSAYNDPRAAAYSSVGYIRALMGSAKKIDGLLNGEVNALAGELDGLNGEEQNALGEIVDRVGKRNYTQDLSGGMTAEMNRWNTTEAAQMSKLANTLALNPAGTFASKLGAGLPGSVASYKTSANSAQSIFSSSFEQSNQAVQDAIANLFTRFYEISNATAATNPAVASKLKQLQDILSGTADAVSGSISSAQSSVQTSAQKQSQELQSAVAAERSRTNALKNTSTDALGEAQAALQAGDSAVQNLHSVIEANQNARSNSAKAIQDKMEASVAMMSAAMSSAIASAVNSSSSAVTDTPNTFGSSAIINQIEEELEAYMVYLAAYNKTLMQTAVDNESGLDTAEVGARTKLTQLSQSMMNGHDSIAAGVAKIANDQDDTEDLIEQIGQTSDDAESSLQDPVLSVGLDLSEISNLQKSDSDISSITSAQADTFSGAISDVDGLISKVTG